MLVKNIKKGTRLNVLSKYGNRCAYCGVSLLITTLQVDHILPKNRHLEPHLRGTDKLYNLNPSCASCNSSKSTWSIEEFRDRILYKIEIQRRDNANFRLLERFKLIKVSSSPVIFYFETI